MNTMLLNGREVGRAVMCSFDLAFNQTKTYMSLRLVPIIDILYQLQVGYSCSVYAQRLSVIFIFLLLLQLVLTLDNFSVILYFSYSYKHCHHFVKSLSTNEKKQ